MSVVIDFKGEKVELLDRDKILYLFNKDLAQDNWVLDTFYPNRKGFSDTSKVDFGELETNELLAPFVSSNAKARQIGAGGRIETWSVEAAYLKPSRAIAPTTVHDDYIVALLRRYGVVDGARYEANKLSNAEKLRICQMTNAIMNHQAIDNRKTLMGLDVLFKGYTEYQGEDFEYYKADFRRSSDMTYNAPTTWDDNSADVVADFDKALQQMFDESGTQPEVILSTSKVFNLARNNPKFKERFTRADGSNTPDNTTLPTFMRSVKPKLVGMIDNTPWWTYDAKHKLLGAEEHYVSPKHLYLISDTNGTRCQCQIKHLDVLGSPLEYYDYVDVSKNPSVIEQITDSAPLMAPSTSNGVMAMKVLA